MPSERSMLSLSAFHKPSGFISLWWSILPAQQGELIFIMDTRKHTEGASCPLPAPTQTHLAASCCSEVGCLLPWAQMTKLMKFQRWSKKGIHHLHTFCIGSKVAQHNLLQIQLFNPVTGLFRGKMFSLLWVWYLQEFHNSSHTRYPFES